MADATLELTKPETEKKTIKVLLAEPSSGQVDSIVYDNRKDVFMEFARLEARSDFKFGTGNLARLHVSAARETMADYAISEGFDWLFMVDDDMLIPKDTFERMWKMVEAHKADIVAPLCTQRVHPYNPVLWRYVQKEVNGQKTDAEVVFMHDYEPNSVIFPDAVGFGVVLISVPLLKRLKKPWFFSNTNIGEDIWFCLRARLEQNAKIVCDTSIKIQHMGYAVPRSEYDWIKGDKARFEKFKHLYTKMIPLDPDPNIEQLNGAAQ